MAHFSNTTRSDGDEARAMVWRRARRELDGLPGGQGLNIAHEAVDRHARGGRRRHLALRWLGPGREVRDLTYGELAELSSRFASVLRHLGVGAGERVFSLAGRLPELYVAALGTLKNRSVFCPLFSSFGPEPVRTRLAAGRGKVLVTTESLYRRKVAAIRGRLPELEHVLLIGEGDADAGLPGTSLLAPLLAAADPELTIPPTDPEDPALLHFTSGTSGEPKGALHVHGAVVAHHRSAKLALDLGPDDVYWCTADPGWVTGISYGLIGPLTRGATMIVDSQEFDAERWLRILAGQGVNVWYTAPTAIRMLRRLAGDLVRRRRFPALRLLASVGEPLDAESVLWGREAFGHLFRDTWWQTETGAIMIANHPGVDLRPGSMGRPLPGVEAAIVRRTADGGARELASGDDVVELASGDDIVELASGEVGELALARGWPSMFRRYLGDPELTRSCLRGRWYLTGDLARRDEDGYYWFVGRAGDAIQSAGHLIGPFEVENVLLEHPAVAEAAVVGRPDPLAGEVVHAVVTLGPGDEDSDELRRQILAHARRRLGPAVAPRQIEVRSELPKTRSGKILRRLLRARPVAAGTRSSPRQSPM